LGVALGAIAFLIALSAGPAGAVSFEVRSLNGHGNNQKHPEWGESGQNFVRLAPANYKDGIGQMREGPNPRFISNRVFNSLGIDVFSPRNVSQWGWAWGQFVDHNIELAQGGGEVANIPFSSSDPLEEFTDTLGDIPFNRNPPAPGTGTSTSNPRQQVNTSQTYIDGFEIYGGTQSRLEWLRTGPNNGNPNEQGAELMLPGGYLPTATARGNAATAPSMKKEGRLEGEPQNAIITGDERGNENSELTAIGTLFAREHNRIVNELPKGLSAEEKFQIARRVVGAEMQFITYTAWLPAMGVKLKPYLGYNTNTNPEVSDEFGTAAFRQHSTVDGEVELEVEENEIPASQIPSIEAQGIRVEKRTVNGKPGYLVFIPTGAMFFSPKVVPTIGLGKMLHGLSETPNYKNDAEIDNSLRAVLFETPKGGVSQEECFTDPETAGCFSGVVDLGAIDAQRGRDNGIPTYNALRKALGLKEQTTFDEVTGESSETLPAGETINSPGIMEFTSLKNFFGESIPVNSEPPQRGTLATHKSTLAARLKAIFGSVSNMDSFVGIVSEPNKSGSELGEVETAAWQKQFEALRNGDRFFYLNDPVLAEIKFLYGISFEHTLAELIKLNTGNTVPAKEGNVFFAPEPVRAK
jgi:hypothetical protein